MNWSAQHTQWFWYLAGAVITLVWKWQRYCYEQKNCPVTLPDGTVAARTFWQASRKWWELETLGSQVSWGATIGVVWLMGTVLISKKGAEWFMGGVFMSVPVMAPLSFLAGALAEMVVPDVTKWIVRKFGGNA